MAGMGDLRKVEDSERRESVKENTRRTQQETGVDRDKKIRLKKAIVEARKDLNTLEDVPWSFRKSLKGTARTRLQAYKTDIRQLMRESGDSSQWASADKTLSRLNRFLKSAE